MLLAVLDSYCMVALCGSISCLIASFRVAEMVSTYL
jgi:hypothetical protein